MYSPETTRTNVTRMPPPVLLVDHDREFGTLMRAAFATRGRHVEWTDRVTDALRLLAGHEYDPVIIDLRLHDGSGLDLLDEAASDGMLTCGVVVLASHDFKTGPDTTSRPRVLDLDAFLDRMMAIASRRTPWEASRLSIQFMVYLNESTRWHPGDSSAMALSDLRFALCDLSWEESHDHVNARTRAVLSGGGDG